MLVVRLKPYLRAMSKMGFNDALMRESKLILPPLLMSIR